MALPGDEACPDIGRSCPLSVDSASLPGVSTVPTLLDRLIDDAALFPPGNAPMATAVPAHLEYIRNGGLVGRFLCPASRMDELAAALPPGTTVELGLILDTGLPGLPVALALLRSEPRLPRSGVAVGLTAE